MIEHGLSSTEGSLCSVGVTRVSECVRFFPSSQLVLCCPGKKHWLQPEETGHQDTWLFAYLPFKRLRDKNSGLITRSSV